MIAGAAAILAGRVRDKIVLEHRRQASFQLAAALRQVGERSRDIAQETIVERMGAVEQPQHRAFVDVEKAGGGAAAAEKYDGFGEQRVLGIGIGGHGRSSHDLDAGRSSALPPSICYPANTQAGLIS